MKSASCDCKIDVLGRMVLPKSVRNLFHISEGDRLDIFLDEDSIILKKHVENCFFCGKNENLIPFKQELICSECVKAITKKAAGE